MNVLTKGVELFHHVCAAVIIHQNEPALEWCVNYAIAGSKMNDPEACYVQALYVESNITYWNGGVADSAKELLTKAILLLKEERLG